LVWLALVVALLVAGAVTVLLVALRDDEPPEAGAPRGDAGAPGAVESAGGSAAEGDSKEGSAGERPAERATEKVKAASSATGAALAKAAQEGGESAPPAQGVAREAEVGAADRAEPADAQHVRVTIESDPPGAKVFDIEELVGRTPVTIDVDRDSLPRSYRVVKRGYVRATAEIPEVPEGDGAPSGGDQAALTVSVRLKRRPAARPRPAAPVVAPGGGIKLTR